MATLGESQPLSSFHENLQTTEKTLNVHRSETFTVPVSITNPGPDIWVSAGRFPITVSYKWFTGGQMLAIEGARTVLPHAINPHETVSVNAKVVAPDQAGSYALRISLVQEGVAWFMLKGGASLDLPATVN